MSMIEIQCFASKGPILNSKHRFTSGKHTINSLYSVELLHLVLELLNYETQTVFVLKCTSSTCKSDTISLKLSLFAHSNLVVV